MIPAIELHCSRALALRLGACPPLGVAHHRELCEAGHLLVRDPATSAALFWPWVRSSAEREPTRASS